MSCAWARLVHLGRNGEPFTKPFKRMRSVFYAEVERCEKYTFKRKSQTRSSRYAVGPENSPANANSGIAPNSPRSESARLFKVPVRTPPSLLLVCYPPPHPSCSQSTDQACQPQRNHVSDTSRNSSLSPGSSIS
uniref:Uncharacterized protein n=1 Tax=Mustela putorius furo TaxID=9669 RepID=M3XNN3_MUSPF